MTKYKFLLLLTLLVFNTQILFAQEEYPIKEQYDFLDAGHYIISENYLDPSVPYNCENCIGKNLEDWSLQKVNDQRIISKSDSLKNTFAKNILYAEGLAIGYYTLNFSRSLFLSHKFCLSSRLGFGLVPFKNFDTQYSLPLTLQFLFGRKFCYDAEFGFAYSHGYDAKETLSGDWILGSTLYLMTRPIGVSYRPRNQGFFFNVGFLLLIRVYEFNKEFKNYPTYDSGFRYGPAIGFGAGYCF